VTTGEGLLADDRRPQVVLSLEGDFDVSAASDALKRLIALDLHAGDELVLDLRGLTFMDSTGVRVLLEAAEAEHANLRIIAPAGGDVRVTIEETGIGPLLPLVESDAEERS
jgi:anti-sigma B factor antagonist